MADGATALAAVESPDVVEQPLQETPEQSQETAEQPSTGQRPETPQEKADLRNRPDAIRKALKFLAEQNNGELKGVASQINHEYQKARAFSAVFPKVEDARAAKSLFDSVGGTDGISKLQNTYASIEKIDAQIAAGDPEALEHLFDDDSREGMTKLLGPMIDRVAQQNPQAYAQAITPHAVRFMESEGLVGALNQLIQAFNGDNKESMKDVLGRVVKWYNDLSQNTQAAKPADPERQKFEQEKAEWQKKQHDSAVNEVFNGNLDYAGKKIDEHLKPYLSKLSLDKSGLEELRQLIWKNFETKRNADPAFKLAMNRNYQEGKGFKDLADAKKTTNNYVDQFMKEVVDNRIETLYGKLLKAVPAKVNPTAPAKPNSNGQKPVVKTADPYQRPVSRFDQVLAREVGKLRTQAR